MSHTRRDFLRATLRASACVSLAPALPSWLARSAAAASSGPRGDTALVVVQLSGGNDGLNTLVPYADDAYGAARSTLAFARREVHKIDSYLGFHPRMGAFERLYGDGHLAIVQGVGHASSSRNHEPAMRAWHTADPEHPERRTGWLGRVVDRVADPDEGDVLAMSVGSTARPLGLSAERTIVPSLRSFEELDVRGELAGSRWRETSAITRASTDNPLLDFLQRSARGVCADLPRIREVAKESASFGDYPDFGLAGNLRTVAQVIRADVGVRLFFTVLGGDGFGGFDNHANQLGNHCAMLEQLSESVGAFVDDLSRDGTLKRVLLMTFSEFGRTLAENGRRGTGHGAAAPVFLAGGGLKGGLAGEHPSLTDLDEGAPRYHTDFRRVYATALESWLGLDAEPTLGGRYEPLDVLG